MSFSSSGNNNGRRGRPEMMSEINVTPLVDVMLVLLIIFMVAAPMMTQGLDVNLPKVDSTALQTEEEQTVLTIRATGELFLDELQVPGENLAYQVAAVLKVRGNSTVFIRADQDTLYGEVARIMGQLRQAGITSVGLVTEPADETLPGQAAK